MPFNRKYGTTWPRVQSAWASAWSTIAVGETMDYRYTPDQPGELHLELRQGNGVLLFDQVVMVVQ